MKNIFRFILLIFILTICQNRIEEQNKIDSLQLLLINSEGTEQIDILNNLSQIQNPYF